MIGRARGALRCPAATALIATLLGGAAAGPALAAADPKISFTQLQ